MGQLSSLRVTPARSVYNVGVDFTGPLFIKDGKTRNRKIIKSFLCIFVCFVTKAVHLELVSDLSTNCFLNAVKKLSSEEAFAKNIYSGNATNSVGAKNHLNREVKTLLKMRNEDGVVRFLNEYQINWYYIPPKSPHFGGLWESDVKSAKCHLKRIVSDANLRFEDLYTVFVHVEEVMNFRHITPMSSDPNDLFFLSLAHF